MNIEYDHESQRVKISDYEVGTVFSFEGAVYIKSGFAHDEKIGTCVFVRLCDGHRATSKVHREIDYGSVEILDAKLVVTKRK